MEIIYGFIFNSHLIFSAIFRMSNNEHFFARVTKEKSKVVKLEELELPLLVVLEIGE